jgi:hypothetical protein
MALFELGETFGRRAYVDSYRNKDSYYVSFTDWETRQGGSVDNLTFEQAKELAEKFVQGCDYRFDKQIGIVLELKGLK